MAKQIKYNEEARKKIKIGDELIDGGVVTTLLKFDRNNEIMYSLNDIIVSGHHPVYHNDKKIMVYEHPLSYQLTEDETEYINTLYCLNTTNNLIKIGDILFTDFDEYKIPQLGFSYNTIINGEKIGNIYVIRSNISC